MGSLWGALINLLTSIILFIYDIVRNHGWAVVLFTIFVKLVLLPLDINQRKSMRRMSKLNPKIQQLQKKYANDKEKFNQKQAELYKKEKINPLASCLPMLLSLPILYAMWAVMRNIANTELAKMMLMLQDSIGNLDVAAVPGKLQELLNSGVFKLEPWLWVKNIWMPDSPFSTVLPIGAAAMKAIPPINGVIDAAQIEGLQAFVATQQYQAVLNFFNAVPMPGVSLNLFITKMDIFKNPNGFFILPIVSGATQYLATILQPMDASATQQQGGGSNQFMKYIFPLFSVWICASSNAMFSLYWVTTNVIQIVMQVGLNYYFDMQEKREAANDKGDAT